MKRQFHKISPKILSLLLVSVLLMVTIQPVVINSYNNPTNITSILSGSTIIPQHPEGEMLVFEGWSGKKQRALYTYDIESNRIQILSGKNISPYFEFKMNIASDKYCVYLGCQSTSKFFVYLTDFKTRKTRILNKKACNIGSISISGDYVFWTDKDGDNPGLYYVNAKDIGEPIFVSSTDKFGYSLSTTYGSKTYVAFTGSDKKDIKIFCIQDNTIELVVDDMMYNGLLYFDNGILMYGQYDCPAQTMSPEFLKYKSKILRYDISDKKTEIVLQYPEQTLSNVYKGDSQWVSIKTSISSSMLYAYNLLTKSMILVDNNIDNGMPVKILRTFQNCISNNKLIYQKGVNNPSNPKDKKVALYEYNLETKSKSAILDSYPKNVFAFNYLAGSIVFVCQDKDGSEGAPRPPLLLNILK